jgi:hypothetical protein
VWETVCAKCEENGKGAGAIEKILEVGEIEQLLDLAAEPMAAEKIPAAVASTYPGNEFLLKRFLWTAAQPCASRRSQSKGVVKPQEG